MPSLIPEEHVKPLMKALKPFAQAFDVGGKWHYTEHPEPEKWQDFQDSNSAIPSRDLTMGDFRRAYEALARFAAVPTIQLQQIGWTPVGKRNAFIRQLTPQMDGKESQGLEALFVVTSSSDAPTVPDMRPSVDIMSDRLGHILAVLNGSSFARTEEYVDVRDTIIQLNKELKYAPTFVSDSDALTFSNELEAATWAALKSMNDGGIDYDLLTEEQKDHIAIRRAAELEVWLPIIKKRLAPLPTQRMITVEELNKAFHSAKKGLSYWSFAEIEAGIKRIAALINGKEGV